MTDSSPTFEYDEIGIIGAGACFDSLSEYYHKDTQRLNLSVLDKFQEELDLEITEWSVSENTRSNVLSGDSKKSLLPKYMKRMDSFFRSPSIKTFLNSSLITSKFNAQSTFCMRQYLIYLKVQK